MRDYDPTTGRTDSRGESAALILCHLIGFDCGRLPSRAPQNSCPVDPEALFPPLPHIVNSEEGDVPFGGVEGVVPDPDRPHVGPDKDLQGNKPGGEDQASEDFEGLVEGSSDPRAEGVRTGKDKNGKTITFYPVSSGGAGGKNGPGPPTISGPGFKIRYP